MKKFKVSFEMEIRDYCMIQKPEEMLVKDAEDGMELGYTISNIEVKEIGEVKSLVRKWDKYIIGTESPYKEGYDNYFSSGEVPALVYVYDIPAKLREIFLRQVGGMPHPKNENYVILKQ